MRKRKSDRQSASRPCPSVFGRILRSLLVSGLLLLVLAGAGAYFVLAQLERPGARPADATVTIPRGASTMAVAELLERQGLVPSRWLVMVEILRQRLSGKRRHVKAGEFRIPSRASVREIVEILQSGKAILYKVTIPEGFSVIQVVERLKANPHLTGEIAEMPAEGSLLPDTYVFQRGESRMTLIRRMQEAQRRLLDALWPKRAPDLPFKTRREAVILASIVEKETALPHERRRVAAVFINRLKKGMRLQADPTIIYGITRGKPLGRPIRKSEIEADHPWNTYRIKGLPPTPIANPGRESIAAVLNPEKTDDLYFVADGKGGHVFAATLKAHNENVRRWRRIRRQMEAEAQRRRQAAQVQEKENGDGHDDGAGERTDLDRTLAGLTHMAGSPAGDALTAGEGAGEGRRAEAAAGKSMEEAVGRVKVPLPRPRPANLRRR